MQPYDCSGDENSVRYVAFNQDNTALCVGCDSGFRLFSLNNIDKLDESFYQGNLTNVVIVERLYLSSLVVTVSQSSPRKLSLCHFKKGNEICNYSYQNRILGVKLNRKRLVVCLTDSLYIHNIRDMKVIHTIKDTPDNPRGVCALCPSDDVGYLAYPGSTTMGEVQVFDTQHLVPVISVPAHDNPVTVMNFNQSGDKLATASEKGTLIRVFSMPDGNKVFEFRRGVKRCVSIHSLTFSSDSQYLASSSNTETVHVFKLEKVRRTSRSGSSPGVGGGGGGSPVSDDGNSAASASQTWMGYFGQAIMDSAGSYLPSNVGEVFTQGRATFQARLPNQALEATNNICALARINKVPRLIIASTCGYLYIFSLDLSDSSGDCVLIKQHRINGTSPKPLAAQISPAVPNHLVSQESPEEAYSGRGGGITNPGSNAIDIPMGANNHVYGSPGLGPGSYPSSSGLPVGGGGGTPSEQELVPGGGDSTPSYAGALAYSPPSDGPPNRIISDEHSRPAIQLDDENEFPPMTMNIDD